MIVTVGTEERGTGIRDPPFMTDEPASEPELWAHPAPQEIYMVSGAASEVAFTTGRLSARAVPLRIVMQNRNAEVRVSFLEIIRVPLGRV